MKSSSIIYNKKLWRVGSLFNSELNKLIKKIILKILIIDYLTMKPENAKNVIQIRWLDFVRWFQELSLVLTFLQNDKM